MINIKTTTTLYMLSFTGLESGEKSSIMEGADMSLQSLQYLESKAGPEFLYSFLHIFKFFWCCTVLLLKRARQKTKIALLNIRSI
jgi:hypothetical protein